MRLYPGLPSVRMEGTSKALELLKMVVREVRKDETTLSC